MVLDAFSRKTRKSTRFYVLFTNFLFFIVLNKKIMCGLNIQSHFSRREKVALSIILLRGGTTNKSSNKIISKNV